jgi:5-methyltetrahydrofolate corrinoid/iron sulfur protein methyltransferase
MADARLFRIMVVKLIIKGVAMIITGEKINGTRNAVALAIRERNADFIRNLAESQIEGGSAFLDITAGAAPELESDDIAWLVKTIQ